MSEMRNARYAHIPHSTDHKSLRLKIFSRSIQNTYSSFMQCHAIKVSIHHLYGNGSATEIYPSQKGLVLGWLLILFLSRVHEEFIILEHYTKRHFV